MEKLKRRVEQLERDSNEERELAEDASDRAAQSEARARGLAEDLDAERARYQSDVTRLREGARRCAGWLRARKFMHVCAVLQRCRT